MADMFLARAQRLARLGPGLRWGAQKLPPGLPEAANCALFWLL